MLAYLFGHPDRSFYASEMIALAGSGSGAVQRELSRLAQCGLATMNRIGKQTHYQANTAKRHLRGTVQHRGQNRGAGRTDSKRAGATPG